MIGNVCTLNTGIKKKSSQNLGFSFKDFLFETASDRPLQTSA